MRALLALLRRAIACLAAPGAARPGPRHLWTRVAAARPSSSAPLAAARRAWGEIRARYRLMGLMVPA